MRTIYLCLLLLAGITACNPNRLTLPEPARSIEGTYEAQNAQSPFPVAGQTVQLIVRRVATDSVSVTFYAPTQPADSVRYERAYVKQEFGQFSATDGCVGYRIYLTDQRELDQLVMSCDAPNVFRYLHQRAGPQSYTVLNFRKL